ncbi:MAG TPA: hypothetical protein VMW35_21980 [Myxococcota bacterium]|jgi:hypothetical protein|nr:hypothetical protein [Myxococcota bacterium]
MSERIRVDEILRFLALDDRSFLDDLRREGLFVSDEVSPDEAEDLRLAALLVRELGVNPAGVDVILHLRRRVLCLEGRMRGVLERLLAEPERR